MVKVLLQKVITVPKCALTHFPKTNNKMLRDKIFKTKQLEALHLSSSCIYFEDQGNSVGMVILEPFGTFQSMGEVSLLLI